MPLREDYPDPPEYNLATAKELRESGGATGDFAGRTALILTMAGAKSGRLHETPPGSTDVNGRILSAGVGGSNKHPAWFPTLSRIVK
jgi:hypothetical protein